MGIKDFFKSNKRNFFLSCLIVTLTGYFIMLIKHLDLTTTSIFILCSFPAMFLMAYGIYEFTGGEK